MDSLDGVLVNFADVDEQDLAGFEPCADLLRRGVGDVAVMVSHWNPRGN